MKIIYREIADYLEKSEQSIKHWKIDQPQLLEFAKNGALLKKYNCDDHEHLKEMIELDQFIKESGMSYTQLKELLEAVKKCR